MWAAPFAAIACFILLHAAVLFLGGNTRTGLTQGAIGLLFVGLTVGALWGLQRLRQNARALAQLQVRYPGEPWRWRPDWGAGEIRSSNLKTLLGSALFALVWNAISVPISIVALRQELPRGNRTALLVLLFPLVGLALAAWAIRTALQFRRFGTSTFKLSVPCGSPGGHLSGTVLVPTKLPPGHPITLHLRCVQHRHTSNDDDSEGVTVWEETKTIARELFAHDRSRSAIPVFFNLPADAPPTSQPDPRDRVVWQLRVSADVPGVNYQADFEVPVFRTRSTAEPAPPLPDPTVAFQVRHHADALSPDSKVRLVDLADGGQEIYLPAFRNPGAVLSSWIFLLVWGCIPGVMVFLGAPVLFPVLFALFGLLILWGTLELTFQSIRIVVSRDQLLVESSRLGLTRRRQWPADIIARVTVAPGMRSGMTQYYDLTVSKGSRLPARIPLSLRHRHEAEFIARTLSAVLGKSGPNSAVSAPLPNRAVG